MLLTFNAFKVFNDPFENCISVDFIVDWIKSINIRIHLLNELMLQLKDLFKIYPEREYICLRRLKNVLRIVIFDVTINPYVYSFKWMISQLKVSLKICKISNIYNEICAEICF